MDSYKRARNRMRHEQLRYLEAVICAGSFHKAATRLGITQPSLSSQIQRLEEDLGVVLVRRNARGVQPTEATEALLPYVRAALRSFDAVREEANSIIGVRTGRVRVGAIPASTRFGLPLAVKTFRQKYPTIELEIEEHGASVVRKFVSSGRFDVGLLSRFEQPEQENSSLRYVDLARGRVLICVPSCHELAGHDSVKAIELAGQEFIAYHKGSLLREAFERIARSVAVSAVYYMSTTDNAERMVAAGVGICLTSSLAPVPEDLLSVITFVPLDEAWAFTQTSVALRCKEQTPPAVRAFVEVIKKQAASLVLERPKRASS